MSFFIGMLCAVPDDRTEEFVSFSRAMTEVFKEYGAILVVDSCGLYLKKPVCQPKRRGFVDLHSALTR